MTLVPQSIRWRIQLWHGLLLLLVLVSFCALAWRLKTQDIANNLDRELATRLDAVMGVLGRQPQGPQQPGPGGDADSNGDLLSDLFGDSLLQVRPPRPAFIVPSTFDSLFGPANAGAFYYVVWGRDGPLLTHSAAAPADVRPPEEHTLDGPPNILRTDRGRREVARFTPMGECILVGKSMAAEEAEMRQFAWWLGSLGSAVMLLGLAGGWMIASRAIRPIDDISATALRISAGNLDERINVGTTESELGRLAGVLNSTFARLHDAFEQQARFSSDAAHELRTPVAVILAQTEFALAEAGTPAERDEALAACRRAAQRMHSLIQSLLDLAVLNDTTKPLDRQPCDLAEVMSDNVALIRPLADQRQITLHTDLTCTPCSANRDSLSQVVTNLLSNAVKFSRNGDEVRVRTHRDNGTAVISIADTGPGIAAEHLPHIFERFYRVDASRNRSKGGAGLGLSICQSIATAHGGTLSVESTPGRGSTFTLRIPASGQDR